MILAQHRRTQNQIFPAALNLEWHAMRKSQGIQPLRFNPEPWRIAVAPEFLNCEQPSHAITN
jgi:hypothetical protein